MSERRESTSPSTAERIRRTVDVVVSVGLLAVLALPLCAIAALVRLDSRGPALFRQERVGRDRRTFTMLKFRTMRLDGDDTAHRQLVVTQLTADPAVADSGAVHKLHDDPRITRVGSFLRRWSLDELPQLINVAAGDMTLVGPRPCLPWEAELFSPHHQLRFTVKPGLTGLWQVSGRGGFTMKQALDLDVEYVRRRSLLLDARLLVKTPAALLRSRRETA